jgi:hypothetical protein
VSLESGALPYGGRSIERSIVLSVPKEDLGKTVCPIIWTEKQNWLVISTVSSWGTQSIPSVCGPMWQSLVPRHCFPFGYSLLQLLNAIRVFAAKPHSSIIDDCSSNPVFGMYLIIFTRLGRHDRGCEKGTSWK